ncbi:MAG: hypothetical protein IT501_01780 [Rubrivivax sp.]|jgi:hypothetical protein|nr:hypothetical protein [Rubrivivax sp.]
MKRIALAGTLALTLLTATLPALAQGATSAPASAAKKELAARIVKLQQPGIDMLARQLVEAPVMQIMQQAGVALQQRVAADRRQAVANDIQADARKYAEEMNPIAREKATKLAPGIVQPILEEKFTEDELRQLITIIESPVNRKYQALGPDMQRALGEKLVAELKPALEPRLKALAQTVGSRLQPAGAASGATSGK